MPCSAPSPGTPTSIEELRNRHGEVSPNAPDYTSPADEFLVLDADSSQSYAINSIVAGKDLVIEGPPGTGKSQTIANLIATLSARGKRVLFVAEKRAAIDAVLDRLRDVDLGGLVARPPRRHRRQAQTGPGPQEVPRRGDVGPGDRTWPPNRSSLVHRREALVQRTDALHKKRAPWDISAYELQAELIGVPDHVQERTSASARRRWRGSTAEVYRRTQEDLEQFVGIGGLAHRQRRTAHGCRHSTPGRSPLPEQAGAVMEAMTNFTQHTLPDATERIEGALVRSASPALRRWPIGPAPSSCSTGPPARSESLTLPSSSWTSRPRWPGWHRPPVGPSAASGTDSSTAPTDRALRAGSRSVL